MLNSFYLCAIKLLYRHAGVFDHENYALRLFDRCEQLILSFSIFMHFAFYQVRGISANFTCITSEIKGLATTTSTYYTIQYTTYMWILQHIAFGEFPTQICVFGPNYRLDLISDFNEANLDSSQTVMSCV